MNELNITKLRIDKTKTCFYSPEKCPYKPEIRFNKEQIKKSFNHAYRMTFEGEGEFRDHRSEGTKHRKIGEIFANAFQGKLAEYGFKEFYEKKYGENTLSTPSTDCWKLGIWDTCDFKSKYGLISVKSTKHYSNLLLLEEKDWNEDGCYIPNKNCVYILIALVRLGIDIDSILKENKLLYANECKKEKLEQIFFNDTYDWSCDLPGYIKQNDLCKIISEQVIIKKGDFLNKTSMDATNYYIKVNELRAWPEKI